MLFREYWGRQEATAAAFDSSGYFATGDIVEVAGDPPYYRVRGGAAA
jgi:long-subunit acyl-CoA synthetase (AMP-forming)